MSSVQVQHDVLFCCSDRPCFTPANVFSISTSPHSPRLHFSLSGFPSLPKTYQTPGRDVWSIKWLKHHYFLRNPSISHHVGFFPSVGDMRAAANKLFCQPSDEPQRTFVKDYERHFFFFVIEMLRSSDQWEKDKRAAWEPNRKSLWTLGLSSRSASEKHF